jgi:hypothetical protein
MQSTSAWKVITHLPRFASCQSDSDETLSVDASDPSLPSVKAVAVLLCKLSVNSYLIFDADQRPLGHGLYKVGSSFNHAAEPNVAQIFSGRKLRLHAVTDIEPVRGHVLWPFFRGLG